MVMVFIRAMWSMNSSFWICAALVLSAGFSGCAEAKSYDVGTEESAEYVEAKPVFNPQPDIPSTHSEQCFKSCCIARFFIGADGKTKVKLVSTSGSLEIDDITLITLRRWKFKPAMLDGKPVESTRRIKVEFEVN